MNKIAFFLFVAGLLGCTVPEQNTYEGPVVKQTELAPPVATTPYITAKYVVSASALPPGALNVVLEVRCGVFNSQFLPVGSQSETAEAEVDVYEVVVDGSAIGFDFTRTYGCDYEPYTTAKDGVKTALRGGLLEVAMNFPGEPEKDTLVRGVCRYHASQDDHAYVYNNRQKDGRIVLDPVCQE